MMKRRALARYWRLGRDERRVVRRAAIVLLVVRRCASRLGVTRTRRIAGGLVFPSPLNAERVAHLVAAVAAGLPGATPCLTRAIVTEAFLIEGGHSAELRIGLAAREGRTRVEAHAWIELDGRALEPVSRYVTAPIFGVRG